jgi:hypothetical protein
MGSSVQFATIQETISPPEWDPRGTDTDAVGFRDSESLGEISTRQMVGADRDVAEQECLLKRASLLGLVALALACKERELLNA